MGQPTALRTPTSTKSPTSSSLIPTALAETAEQLKQALGPGVDVNEANGAGATPLMVAVDDPKKVRLLLDRGAKANHDCSGDK